MGIVHEPVEDAVGQRGIADLFVPARDRQLRNQDRGANLVAILADLPQVAPELTNQTKRSLAMYRRNRLQSGNAANCVRNQGRPCNRCEGIEAGEAGGRHTSVPYEARISADPFKRGVRTPGL